MKFTKLETLRPKLWIGRHAIKFDMPVRGSYFCGGAQSRITKTPTTNNGTHNRSDNKNSLEAKLFVQNSLPNTHHFNDPTKMY